MKKEYQEINEKHIRIMERLDKLRRRTEEEYEMNKFSKKNYSIPFIYLFVVF